MNLKTLIQGELETEEEFLSRTYWAAHSWSPVKVFVYNNQQDRDNPECLNFEEWTKEKALRHMAALESEDERARNGGNKNGKNKLE